MLDEELDRRIRTALDDVPAAPAPPGGLEAVTARGRQLRRRRLVPMGAVAVLVVVAGSLLVLASRSTSNEVVTAAGGDNRQTAEEGLAASPPRPAIVSGPYGPLAARPLSDDPLPLLSNVVVRGDGFELIVTSSTDPGKELSIKGPVGSMAFTPSTPGHPSTPPHPLSWYVGGSGDLPPQSNWVVGVTRQEIDRVEYSTDTETATANTIRSEEFPSLRFFAIALTERPAPLRAGDAREAVDSMPVLVAYDGAGREMIRREARLTTSPPTSVVDD